LNSPSQDRKLGSIGNCSEPIRPEPEFVERVWGAPDDSEAIRRIYPQAPHRSAKIGEVWLTGNENRIASGTWTGRKMHELMGDCGPSILGKSRFLNHPSGRPVFPLLVKFLFTTDKLSVQVHPPDRVARLENSWGKTEMWHILAAGQESRLAVGFRSEVPKELLMDAAKLRASAASGEIEEMLDWLKVRAGETYFVPAGTVHAIGAGITLCEIQQNSDITYRLYDYNRLGTDGKPRALHIDPAVKVINPRSDGGRTSPVAWEEKGGQQQLLAACPYFATERWELQGTEERSTPDRMEIWIALQGSATFETAGASDMVRAGEVIVIPANAKSFLVRPRTKCAFLRTYPPDWNRDIVEPLRASGKTPEALPQTCFLPSMSEEGATR
jgi:mannose-6-phosphate isomerase